MSGGLRGPAFVLAGAATLLMVTSCSGGGSSGNSGTVPIPRATPTPPANQTASAQFVITWPTSTAPTGQRRRAYLSNGTKSVTIVVDGGAATVVNNPNLSPGTSTGFTQKTTVSVPAPVGTDTFLVSDYDATGGTGDLLAQNSVPATIVIDQVNTVSITLDGNLSKIVCGAVSPFVTGTNPFTMVGPAGQLTLLPEDAASDIIISPGTIPALALAPANAAQANVTSTSTTNLFDVNILAAAGTAVTFTASGENLASAKITGTCTVTREEALYVANHGPGGANPSISIYAASDSASSAPVATIAGSKTELTAIQYVAVDPKGDVFVSNEGPQPGQTYGPTPGFVSIYGPGPGSNGNQAPIGLIPNLDTPEGLGFDSKNNLYVLSIDRVGVYPPTADGVTGPAAPSSTLAAPSPPPTVAPSPSASPITNQTDLFSCYGLALDASDNIYTACSNVLNEFPAGSSGNVAPSEIEAVGTTADSFSSHSWLDVAVDGSGNIYAPASNNNLNLVDVFGAGSGANPAATPLPADESISTGYSQPLGIFIDPNNEIFVGNYGNSTVEAFSSMTTFTAGLAGATYSTGVVNPFGIYVR